MLVSNFNPRRHETQNYSIQIFYERKGVQIYNASGVLNNESYLCYQNSIHIIVLLMFKFNLLIHNPTIGMYA